MPVLLQICVEGNTGSTGTIAEAIGELVMLQGWGSYIAHGRFPRPSKSQIIRIGTDFEIILHGIETRLFDRHGLGSIKATRELINKIQGIKPDIIHLHHLHGYYINIKLLFNYLSKADIPVVWTFHDCWSITGHCCHFDYVRCDKWKTECKKCPQKKEYPASLFADKSTKNYILKKELFTSVKKMVIVPVSNWLENIIGQSFLAGIPVQTIHNGVNISVYKPQKNRRETREKYNIRERFMILGVASPWNRRKGLNDFIQLSKLLNENEVIVLVGLSNIQLKQIPHKIIGLSKTENRQMLIDLYSAADLFMNTTWEDNFPTTNLESLSCGTPIVTYRTGGSIEAVSSETGFIVDKGDIKSLIDCIRIVNKNGKQAYSDSCRSQALSLFSRDVQFAKYLDLYQRLLSI